MTLTPFDETLTAQRTPLFTLSSVHPLSQLRNETTGTPTHTGQEYQIEANEAIETAEIGRYVPGFSAEAGIGVRIGTLPTGSQVMRWGYFDDEDGFGWELDADGLSTFVRSNSVDTLTAQVDWTVDAGDGSGPSDATISLSRGNIWQIRFTWYGYGQIEYNLVDTQFSSPHPQSVVPLHRLSPDGSTSTRNPNLPLRAEVVGAGDGVMFLAGRAFSIVGLYTPQVRTHSKTAVVASVGTSFTPILAMRRRDDNDARRIKLRVETVQVFTTAKIEWALVQDPTITFGTADPPTLATAAQSAVEFSDNPSGFSIGTGESIASGFVSASGSGNNASGADSLPGLDLPVPRLRPVVLVARAFTGTADVTGLIRSLEEW